MESTIARNISSTTLGVPQRFKNMEVRPLFNSRNHGPEYLTLDEALAENALSVMETMHDGPGARLKVTNRAPRPVLLLDCEELNGRKRTRAFNQSLLLPGNSETIILISGTEQDRWNHRGDGTSGGTLRIPHPSLNHRMELTAARLENYVRAFRPLPRQRGLLVAINGEIVGLDLFSREEAYSILHPKLIKSYATGALSESCICKDGEFHDEAMNFFTATGEWQQKQYPSAGYGSDYRLEGSTVSGTALVADGHVVHLALFRAAPWSASYE